MKGCSSELSEASGLSGTRKQQTIPELNFLPFQSKKQYHNSGDFSSPTAIFCSEGNLERQLYKCLDTQVSGNNIWANAVFLRHPLSGREHLNDGEWMHTHLSVLSSTPEDPSLVVLPTEFLVWEWWGGCLSSHWMSSAKASVPTSLKHTLGDTSADSSPFTSTHGCLGHKQDSRQWSYSGLDVCIRVTLDRWPGISPASVSLLIDGLVYHHRGRTGSCSYRCFNMFRGYIRGGGRGAQVSKQENITPWLCYRREVTMNVRTRMVSGEGSSGQF